MNMKHNAPAMKIMTIQIQDISDESGKGFYANVKELDITVMADSMEELFQALQSTIALKKERASANNV